MTMAVRKETKKNTNANKTRSRDVLVMFIVLYCWMYNLFCCFLLLLLSFFVVHRSGFNKHNKNKNVQKLSRDKPYTMCVLLSFFVYRFT